MKLELEVRDPRLAELISAEAELEVVASGFQFLEGPVWQPAGRHLIFSDIVGDRMYRWSQAEGVTVFRQPSHMANGNVYDREGRLLTCEHATSRVSRTEPDGQVVVLASHYACQELNSPNDIVVRRDGTIYFSDPNFGRRVRVGVPRPQHQPFQAVYRLDLAANELQPVATDFENPNGLCFSLDEKQLYINDSPRRHIRVFDVQPDGTLAHGRVWAETVGQGAGVPDGMKFDQAGYLYCCGPGGIYIYDAEARCLGVARMPEQAANFHWGDADLRSLYICASTTLYRLRVNIPGPAAA